LGEILVPSSPSHELPGHSGAALDVAFSPDGSKLASSGIDGVVHIWNVDKGDLFKTFTGHKNTTVGEVVFLDNDRVASTGCKQEDSTGCIQGEILVWRITGGIVQMLDEPAGIIGDLDVSPDGLLLAAASRDGIARIWNTESWGDPVRLEHSVSIEAVAFNATSTVLATGSGDKDGADNLVRLWNVSEPPRLLNRVFDGHPNWVTSVDFSPIESLAASGGWSSPSYFWSPGTGSQVGDALSAPTSFVVVFDPSGEILATGDSDNSVRLWSASTNELLGVLGGHRDGWVRGVAFSPDGRTMASAGSGGQVLIWDYRG
jgi:WD40 repeat protein